MKCISKWKSFFLLPLSNPLVILNSCSQDEDCSHLAYSQVSLYSIQPKVWLQEIASSVLVSNAYYPSWTPYLSAQWLLENSYMVLFPTLWDSFSGLGCLQDPCLFWINKLSHINIREWMILCRQGIRGSFKEEAALELDYIDSQKIKMG